MTKTVIWLKIAGIIIIAIGIALKSFEIEIYKLVIALGVIVGIWGFLLHSKNVLMKK